MLNRVLNVQELFYFPGITARYEGHFLISSSDPLLKEITMKMKDSVSEIPKYQLLLKVKDDESYEVSDCCMSRFDNRDHEYTVCYFFCNEIEKAT
ncbi:MAG TPA: hypothetical protein VK250_01085 [Nitrososphaeraceae archaeon]|nr:hypothetical protein [Nitrososphaeraceae archaeon]